MFSESQIKLCIFNNIEGLMLGHLYRTAGGLAGGAEVHISLSIYNVYIYMYIYIYIYIHT